MKRLWILFLLTLVSCLNELPVVPDFYINLESIKLTTIQLEDSVKKNMEGVFRVIEGKDLLGDEVVGRWIKKRWCLHSKHDVVYSENVGGSAGDSIKLLGYIRIVRSGSGTRLVLNILPSEGGLELLSGNVPGSIVIRGGTSDGSKIVLQRIRDLHVPKYLILGHRGGGRNSERLGISENSIEMIRHAEVLGATGVEIDVKETRDGIPILFHDDTFSPRTIRGLYLLGEVDNFDLAQIRTFGRLIYGENIPTLEEALREIIENTLLDFVWIDVKDPSIVKKVIELQHQAMNLATTLNRDSLTIVLGIPNQEILDSYLDNKQSETPVLIELDINTALRDDINCLVWAPRWTTDISLQDISTAKNNNKKVIIWTLDVQEYIQEFLFNHDVDGILSNYPSLISGMYYAQ